MRNVLMLSLPLFAFLIASQPLPSWASEEEVIVDQSMDFQGLITHEFGGGTEGEEEVESEASVNEQIVDAVDPAVDNSPEPQRWIALPRPGSTGDVDDGNGGWCRDVEYREVSGLSDAEEAQLIEGTNEAFYRSFDQRRYTTMTGVVDADLLCPIDQMDGLDPVFIELYVREAIEEQVPRPEPHVPPGYALAGMPAYLVTDHELTVGPIEIDMDLGFTTVQGTVSGTAVTTVDWGDGTVTEHHVAGAPYPHGEIKHTFGDKGEVNIEVVDRWHVEYEAADGAIAGTLTETLVPVTIDAFEVREYRAVRTGGD